MMQINLEFRRDTIPVHLITSLTYLPLLTTIIYSLLASHWQHWVLRVSEWRSEGVKECEKVSVCVGVGVGVRVTECESEWHVWMNVWVSECQCLINLSYMCVSFCRWTFPLFSFTSPSQQSSWDSWQLMFPQFAPLLVIQKLDILATRCPTPLRLGLLPRQPVLLMEPIWSQSLQDPKTRIFY
jgi:hypothetical protein